MIAGFWYKVNGARQIKKRKQAWQRQGSQGVVLGYWCRQRISYALILYTECIWALNFEISAGAIVQRYELSPVDISEIGMLCLQASCIGEYDIV
jgi:hypothetical protein